MEHTSQASSSDSMDQQPPFKCDELDCSYSAKSENKLAKHKVLHAKKGSVLRFKCTVMADCTYYASCKAQLTAHIRKHNCERPFTCNIEGCTYGALSKNALKKHSSTHTVELAFKCDEPGCLFATKEGSGLRKHSRIHTGERPYLCSEPGCAYRASDSGALARHVRIHDFQCGNEGCNFSASIDDLITAHKLEHRKIGARCLLSDSLPQSDAAPRSKRAFPFSG
jgi:uncharacterized Zn-finger protein